MKELHIYIDRLKKGQTEKISESISSDFLEIEEQDLVFDKIFKIDAEAYLANDHLMMQFTLNISVFIPCSICNKMTENSLKLNNTCFSIALSEIKGAVFDFTDEIRSTILNLVPAFCECNQGNCPDRPALKKYLKTPVKDGPSKTKDVYFPFAEDNFFIEL
ncbi:hypothetical protein RHABOEDO_000587 [Candidatus Rhabdochlamydia oedothoracis]|uniref:DUF177 domain-containing protein n=1 Tax=Candidatus Rhabdochlamydia oedothoracis TaxID=2720720 RepID=A0ABX8UZT8_9BACT|nr:MULTISPECIES: hypothetical protein [Rhabdochlamydia]KAG6559217.1 hypothetical protein RHOW815_000782 [Candidatus Rhabdochlamydia sp. W815]QYF48426.1 hypothetical protein RHABOEDO_000587 [Candidatus Rhabdochlamydia oedothoracis]